MWKSTFGKILIRTVLFLVIFTGTVLIMNTISNRGSRAAYVELRGTTLPVVFTCIDGEILSPVPAYKKEMNTSLIRDAVIPLVGDSRTVTVYLDERNMMLRDVKYQLRDTISGNLIEEGDFDILKEQRDGMTGYSCELRMDMARNKEYTFEVVASDNAGELLRFYARVIRLSRDRLPELLVSAEEFHELLLSEENDKLKSTLKEYMDDNAPEDFKTDDPGFVSLQSDYDTLTWGELKPEIVGGRERALTEIYDDGGTIVYRYRICTADDEKMSRIRYYDVEEQFSMEYVPEQDMARVVNYFRRVRENYQDEDFEREINGLNFGLQDHTPNYLLNDDLEYMLFEADDSVWYYDYAKSTLTRLYGSEKTSFLYADAQGIKLLSVDEKDAYYAIYGRMSSGNHEGENGVLVQHFKAEDRTIEECAFIQTNLPYFWLTQELEKLLYMDAVNGQIYYMLNGSLRSYSLEQKEERILVESLDDRDLHVSSDGSVIAFPDSGNGASGYDSLQLWDLVSGKRTTIEKSGMKLAALDFVGTDFVYGAARPDGVRTAADGSTNYLFTSVVFVGRDGKEEKNYQKSGILVSDVRFLSNTIYLTRVTSVEGGKITAEAAPDYISYKVEETRGKAVIRRGDNGSYQLILPSFLYLTSIPEHLIARLSEDTGTEVYVDGKTDEDSAYLWHAGELAMRSVRTGSLVREAVSIRGTVKMPDGSVLYRIRTGAPYLTVAEQVEYIQADPGENGYKACLIMCLQMAGVTVDSDALDRILAEGTIGSWEKAFKEISGGTVRGLNLSGANLETALLYLGDGIPFAVRLEDHYVLVVSFNSDAIRYYDPIMKYEIRTARSDFRRKIAASGNEIYSYISD